MQIMINLPKIFYIIFTTIQSVSVPNLKSFGQMKAELWATKERKKRACKPGSFTLCKNFCQKSCQLKLLKTSLQTNNKIVHVMTAKLSVGFNGDIARQIKKAFFQAHLHSLKNRTRNVLDQLGRS